MKAPRHLDLGKEHRIIGHEYISIGNGFYTGINLRIEALNTINHEKFSPNLKIGNNVSVGDYCHIACVNSVIIGDNTLMGSKVFISDHLHGSVTATENDIPPAARSISFKPVSIGRNVWIGDNVSVLPGVNIGNNVIVGANAVVTHSFPDNSVIAGCPARIIKVLE